MFIILFIKNNHMFDIELYFIYNKMHEIINYTKSI